MNKRIIKKYIGRFLVPLLLIFKSKIYSKEKAYKYLEKECAKKEAIIHRRNKINLQKDLMIIIPVHNVEDYVEKCIDSVINQRTKYTMDVYIVENGSTDHSKEIIEKYNSINGFHVVSINELGAAAARDYALNCITGKYILFLDSDDYLPENAVEVLMDAAYKYNADIVEGNCIFFNNAGDIIHRTNNANSLGKNVSANEMFGQPWAKVCKAELFENVIFPKEYWFEDSVIAWYIYPSCDNKIKISDTVYYYRQNPQGYTSSAKNNPKSIESLWLTEEILDDLLGKQMLNDEIYELYLNQVIVNMRRIRALGKNIEKSAFIISRNTLIRLNYDCKSKLPYKMKLLEKILKRGSYGGFKLLLICWGEL